MHSTSNVKKEKIVFFLSEMHVSVQIIYFLEFAKRLYTCNITVCFFPRFFAAGVAKLMEHCLQIHTPNNYNRSNTLEKKYKQNGRIIKLLSCSNRRRSMPKQLGLSLKKRPSSYSLKAQKPIKRNRENISNDRWTLFIVLVMSDDAQGRTGSAYTILSYDQFHWCDWIGGIFCVFRWFRSNAYWLKVCNVLPDRTSVRISLIRP